MQDESRMSVSATFCRQPRNAVRPEPVPRVSPARGMACKRTNGLCTRTDSIQGGKSPPKPCFSLPSALAGTALRQKSSVFAEGDSFLCGKRFCFYREKTPSGTEKCFIQTVSPPVFLTVRPLFAAVRPVIGHENAMKTLLSDRKFRTLATIRHGRCSRVPHRISTEPKSVFHLLLFCISLGLHRLWIRQAAPRT